jgi:hypothetical protein
MESISAFFVYFSFGFCFGLFFSLSVHHSRLLQTSRSSVYLPLRTPSSANRHLDSVRSRNPRALA